MGVADCREEMVAVVEADVEDSNDGKSCQAAIYSSATSEKH